MLSLVDLPKNIESAQKQAIPLLKDKNISSKVKCNHQIVTFIIFAKVVLFG